MPEIYAVLIAISAGILCKGAHLIFKAGQLFNQVQSRLDHLDHRVKRLERKPAESPFSPF